VKDPRVPLQAAVSVTTRLVPLITNRVVTAAHSSKPQSYRAYCLDEAIRHAEVLLNELKLQQQRLGWPSTRGDAA
jgi:hypothetical protein